VNEPKTASDSPSLIGKTQIVYEILPSFVLGFHGCDETVAERVLAGRAELNASTNDYDWLGHGIYFWENNPGRAMQYARELMGNPVRCQGAISKPAVVGAIIDLGVCMNLLDAAYLHLLEEGYESLDKVMKESGQTMPKNKPVGKSADLLLRKLDCAVIQWVHTGRDQEKQIPFDSVRGVFIEGEPLYPNAGFHKNNHIQLCVRNNACIKGYFRVRG
jgi:hypothetical protein